ncbi:Hypothetical_protein [Hexamita inflata]|uniref:Hypothetical_protein n=1 Tax=Hexamita inflata TaxID=28002 RepID=A0AA86TUM8_9EUKA|nr:Hypothetical protein HINF_LOCUS9903 [Hexamita inflata]
MKNATKFFKFSNTKYQFKQLLEDWNYNEKQRITLKKWQVDPTSESISDLTQLQYQLIVGLLSIIWTKYWSDSTFDHILFLFSIYYCQRRTLQTNGRFQEDFRTSFVTMNSNKVKHSILDLETQWHSEILLLVKIK